MKKRKRIPSVVDLKQQVRQPEVGTFVATYPPLCERSVLLPDRPELMDNSVGDCLSAMLQEDRLMGSDRPYGSRLNAATHSTVKTKSKQGTAGKICHSVSHIFHELHLLPVPVPPAFDGEACMERRQQPTPLTRTHQEMTARNPPGKQQQPFKS